MSDFIPYQFTIFYNLYIHWQTNLKLITVLKIFQQRYLYFKQYSGAY